MEYNSEVFANASGLVITTVEQRDEGDYRCEATNAGGTKQTEGSLHIQGKNKCAEWVEINSLWPSDTL